MRKRLLKPVLVGTLAVIVSAIVAGPAFGQGSGSSPSQQVQSGIPSGYAAIPPEVRRTLGDPRGWFVPGYDDFPNVLRRQNKLTPTETRQLDAAVARVTSNSSSSQQVHQPGVTSGPAALPPEVMKTHTASSTVSGSSGGDFSWSDASVGIGIGLAIAGGLALVAYLGIRRNRTTAVPA